MSISSGASRGELCKTIRADSSTEFGFRWFKTRIALRSPTPEEMQIIGPPPPWFRKWHLIPPRVFIFESVAPFSSPRRVISIRDRIRSPPKSNDECLRRNPVFLPLYKPKCTPFANAQWCANWTITKRTTSKIPVPKCPTFLFSK